jgi:hypothetical protein
MSEHLSHRCLTGQCRGHAQDMTNLDIQVLDIRATVRPENIDREGYLLWGG